MDLVYGETAGVKGQLWMLLPIFLSGWLLKHMWMCYCYKLQFLMKRICKWELALKDCGESFHCKTTAHMVE
ncbi:hypothetical protein Hanom_Chr13g01229481 [Helianthus anomalus]